MKLRARSAGYDKPVFKNISQAAINKGEEILATLKKITAGPKGIQPATASARKKGYNGG